jgi:hypothetical protein
VGAKENVKPYTQYDIIPKKVFSCSKIWTSEKKMFMITVLSA